MNRSEVKHMFVHAAVKVATVLGCSLAAAVLFACAIDNYPSVHFNTIQPDFGRPPRTLSITSWGEAPCRPLGNERQTEHHYNPNWDTIGQEALANARRLESVGKFRQSMPHYENALRHGAGDPAAIQDRREIISEMTRKTDRALLNEYLAARRDYEFSRFKRAESRMKKLAHNPRAGFLQAHALYVLGATSIGKKAASTFERLAKVYRRSLRREAALIMIARSLLWAASPSGQDVVRSRNALRSLLRDYPRSRFRDNALGWLARCDYVRGRTVAALEAYLRQYGNLTTEPKRESAAASIHFVSRRLTPSDAKVFARHLRRNASLLSPYLEYRIDHGHGNDRDLAGLADLATSAARRSRLRLPARVAAQLAEIQYLRHRYRDAVKWSNHALSSLPGDGKDLAIYVRGASFRKMGKDAASVSDFQRLLREYPSSYLCGGARENLALLYEQSGRLDLALDEYYRLGYDEDAAYILDVRMTTRQVAEYLSARPAHKRHDLLVYTLGIRQLRDNRLSESLRTLARLTDRTVRKMMSLELDDPRRQVARDPRKTARDLGHLERAVRKARGSDAKAAALYDQASYIYRMRNLLFYNAALWGGRRVTDFDFFWDAQTATRRDQESLRRHNYEHECLNRARKICIDLARRYPKSPSAPKALYRGAVATFYLANLNYWWRYEAQRTDLRGQSIRLMKRVYMKYPEDPLAKPARKYAHVFAVADQIASREAIFQVAHK